MTSDDRPLLLTLDDVAAELQVSESSVRRLIEHGLLAYTDIHAVKGGRPRLRVPRAVLEEFIAARTTTSPIRATDAPWPPG
ncbi:helix-turn-helix domain-containing protein [Klenkia soli]|uniref:helix-turn-helix domain-containing protein n=1 Tax=Klenkia soli TaxID=1052260 RepID=UPI0013F4DAAB|nr:helix-turn-helix domain-containing protein [Klenkia soli]